MRYNKVSEKILGEAAQTATHISLYCHGVENTDTIAGYSFTQVGTLLIFDDRKPEQKSDLQSSHYQHNRFREVWSPDLSANPFNGIHGVGLWACSTAKPLVGGIWEKNSIENLSMIDKLMCRGCGYAIAPIFPVYDYTTALIASHFYQALGKNNDEEQVFTLSRSWYFKEAIPRLLDSFRQAREKGHDYSNASRLAFEEILNSLGNDITPSLQTGAADDTLLGVVPRDEYSDEEDLERDATRFELLLTDPKNWNLVLWRGGKMAEEEKH